MRMRLLVCLWLASLVLGLTGALSACNSEWSPPPPMPPPPPPLPETAQHALRVFCLLHHAEITHTVLTQEWQRRAGTIVCNAVGLSLGS